MLGSCDKIGPSVEVATSVFALHAHLIPARVFAAAQLDRMEEIMGGVRADFASSWSSSTGEANTSTRSSLSPDGAPSRLVNSLKGDSSCRLRQAFPELARTIGAPRVVVRAVVAGSVGGAPVSVLKAYIAQQDCPTKRFTPGLRPGALPRDPR
jgi:putative transposase